TRTADATFTTQPLPPPAVTTGSASAITRTTATVAGTVSPGGAQASYRVMATSVNGMGSGPDRTFTTLPPTPPGVAMGAVTGVDRHGATLHGTVNPNALVTVSHFEWGTDA